MCDASVDCAAWAITRSAFFGRPSFHGITPAKFQSEEQAIKIVAELVQDISFTRIVGEYLHSDSAEAVKAIVIAARALGQVEQASPPGKGD